MCFRVRIEGDLPINGFDIGELILINPKTGEESKSQPNSKCYMVYVELSVLLHQLMQAKINQTKSNYCLPNGSQFIFDGPKDQVEMCFPEMKMVNGFGSVLSGLRQVIAQGLKELEANSDREEVMVEQLYHSLKSTEDI